MLSLFKNHRHIGKVVADYGGSEQKRATSEAEARGAVRGRDRPNHEAEHVQLY